MKDSITIDETIELLNSMLNADRPATAALVANRVPCNEALADHDTIQVSEQNGGFHVGLLGVINGLFGVDEYGWGPIATVWTHDVGEFGFLERFERAKPRCCSERCCCDCSES